MDFEENESRYILEFNSFKLGSSEKWCPKVLVKDVSQNKVFPLLWDATCDSEEDANEFAITMINDYLGKNL